MTLCGPVWRARSDRAQQAQHRLLQAGPADAVHRARRIHLYHDRHIIGSTASITPRSVRCRIRHQGQACRVGEGAVPRVWRGHRGLWRVLGGGAAAGEHVRVHHHAAVLHAAQLHLPRADLHGSGCDAGPAVLTPGRHCVGVAALLDLRVVRAHARGSALQRRRVQPGWGLDVKGRAGVCYEAYTVAPCVWHV